MTHDLLGMMSLLRAVTRLGIRLGRQFFVDPCSWIKQFWGVRWEAGPVVNLLCDFPVKYDVLYFFMTLLQRDRYQLSITGSCTRFWEVMDFSEGTPLVETLKNMTRELRPTGIRIIISTQGEYVFFFFQLGSKHSSVRRTNLCSFRIARSLRYRYYAQVSSLPWWGRAAKHFSGNLPVGNTQAFDRLVNLQTGEAIIIAPSAFAAPVSLLSASPLLAPLRCRYFIARTRYRVTKDGGASILVL